MVKIDNFQQANQANSQANQFPNPQANSQQQFNSQSSMPNSEQKGLLNLPPAFLNMLPWIPFAVEAITGQKVPQMSGTIAEIQQAIQQIQFTLSQVLSQQQQMLNTIANLETNASNQFNHLISQVQNIQSIRLTHSKEHKAIEYNHPLTNEE